jgi:hypothetical protein
MTSPDNNTTITRTRNLAVRVPEELHDAVMKRAKAEGKTLTVFVIEALREPRRQPGRPEFLSSFVIAESARYRMALEAILSISPTNHFQYEEMVAIARKALA